MATKSRHARSGSAFENEERFPILISPNQNQQLVGLHARTPRMFKSDAWTTGMNAQQYTASPQMGGTSGLTVWQMYEEAERFVCGKYVFVNVKASAMKPADICASLGFELAQVGKPSLIHLKQCLLESGSPCSSPMAYCARGKHKEKGCPRMPCWLKDPSQVITCKEYTPCESRYIRMLSFDDVSTGFSDDPIGTQGQSLFNYIVQEYHGLTFTNVSIYNGTTEYPHFNGDPISVISQPNFMGQYYSDLDWRISRKVPFSFYSAFFTLATFCDDPNTTATLCITGMLKGCKVAEESIEINVSGPVLFQPDESKGFRDIDDLIFGRLPPGKYGLYTDVDNLVVGL